MIDALNAGNWQRGGDKKVTRPKPLPRPGQSEGKRRSTLSDTEKERRLLDLEARARG